MSDQFGVRPSQSFDVKQEDEIDLVELWRTILKHKRMILRSGFGAAVLAAAISLMMPNIYQAQILLAPAQTEDAPAGGIASALGGLGGLASMAGISLGGGNTAESLAVLQSREFLWKFVQEKKIQPILFEPGLLSQSVDEDPPGQWDVYRLFIEDKMLLVTSDEETGLIAVSINWEDPELAAEWTNDLVARLNQYLAQKAILRSEQSLSYLNQELMRTQVAEMRKTLYDLIASEQRNAMLASTQKDFAFKVLDPAVAPDKKLKPKRAIIVILSSFVAGFMAMLYAFIKEGMTKRREQEDEQAKLSDN
jgi:uncharacterized protein involved in exopolysaccharide biosynthesis